jgi:hypothetical protein
LLTPGGVILATPDEAYRHIRERGFAWMSIEHETDHSGRRLPSSADERRRILRNVTNWLKYLDTKHLIAIYFLSMPVSRRIISIIQGRVLIIFSR